MTVTEICLIIITSILAIKGLLSIIVLLIGLRVFKKDIEPIIQKSEGIVNNISIISEKTREEVEGLQTIVEDVSYQAREVTTEIKERIMPVIHEFGGALSGLSKVISFFFSRKKQDK